MKVAYIAHPVGGDVKNNLAKIVAIGYKINQTEPEVIPFAPYYFDCNVLNDDIPVERNRGIKNNVGLMKKGFIDEIRLYGPTISKGMKEEIKLALELKIPVIPCTYETFEEYKKLYPKKKK